MPMTSNSSEPEDLLAQRAWVRSLSRALVSDEFLADDIEQDLWVRALSRPPQIRSSARGWLAMSLRGLLSNQRRAARRRKRHEQEAAAQRLNAPSQPESPAATVAHAEAHQRVVIAVMGLPEPYKSALLLRYFEGLSPAGVAARLGVPVETARTRVKRGLARLRLSFDEAEGGDRRAWCLALLPLVGEAGPVPVAPLAGTAATQAGVTLGAAIMAKKIAVGVVILLVVGAVWWSWARERNDIADPGPTDPLARLDEPAETPALRGTGTGAGEPMLPREVRGRSTIVGSVTRVGHGVEAAIELRLVCAFRDAAPGAGFSIPAIADRLLDGGTALTAPVARTRSDAKGAFALSELGVGWYDVAATDARGLSVRARVVIEAEGARVAARLELPPSGETLRGRVLYADGKPFQGAVVVEREDVYWSSLTRTPGARVATVDAEGRFVVGGLPPNAVLVSALVPGTRRVIGLATLPRATEYVLTIDPGGGSGSARVLDAQDKTPVAGATVVTSYKLGTVADFRRRTTDGAGRLPLPTAEVMTLMVTADGYAPHVAHVAVEASESVDIYLRRAARVAGRVLTEDDGTPVPDVDVYVLSLDPDAPLLVVESARTDEGGRFTLEGLVHGPVALFALGAGYASVGLDETCGHGYNPLAHSLTSGTSEEIDLRVRETGHVEGRVTTTDGRAVAGAVVRVKELPLLDALASLPGAGGRGAVTDADGRYRLETFVPGVTTRLELAAAGYPTVRSDGLRLEAGETRELDFVLARSRWLDLRVEGSHGKPIGGAFVKVEGEESDGGGSLVLTTGLTDGEGQTRLGPLRPGPVAVEVVAPGAYLDVDAWHQLPDSGGDGDVTARVTLEQGVSLSGRVVVPEGAPPTRVEAHVNGRGAGRWVYEFFPIAADGSWHIEGLPGGADLAASATLTWKGRRWKSEVRTESGASDVLLVLEPTPGPARAVLRVVDAEGLPVPAGLVRMRVEGESWASSHRASISKGRAAFERTDPGAAGTQLWFVLGPFPDGTFEAVVAGPYDGATMEDIVIRLGPGRSVSGRAVDEQGNGVSGIHVAARPARAELPGAVRDRLGRALSGPDGVFEIHGLGAETYTLEADVPPRYLAPATILVEAPRSDVVFRLQSALQARVTVLDAAGAPLEGALVKVVIEYATANAQPAEGSPATPAQPLPSHEEVVGIALTNASGVAVLSGLEPDLVGARFEVRPPRDRPDLLAHQQLQWMPKDETVRLGHGLEVSGVVRDRAGAPVPEAVVEFRIPGTETWSAVTLGTDASFVLGPMPPGDVELRLGVHPGAMNPPRRVPAGSANVVLALDAGLSLRIRVAPSARSTSWRAFLGVGATPRLPHDARWLDAQGRIRFIGLRPDTTYAVWVPELDGGLCALAENLTPGSGEIVLTPQPGLAIAGRVELPSGAEPEWLRLTVNVGGFLVEGSVMPDGTFRVAGLPAGTWSLSARAGTGSETSWESTARAASGSRDVTLRLTETGE